MKSHVVERALEVPMSLLGLIFFAPLMLVIALLIQRDGGPCSVANFESAAADTASIP